MNKDVHVVPAPEGWAVEEAKTPAGRKLFATRVRELAETDPSLADITEPLLAIVAAEQVRLLFIFSLIIQT